MMTKRNDPAPTNEHCAGDYPPCDEYPDPSLLAEAQAEIFDLYPGLSKLVFTTTALDF